MLNKIVKIMEELTKLETEECIIQQKIRKIKHSKEKDEAIIRLGTDWKAEKITNEKGREAFINTHLINYNDDLNRLETSLMWNKMHQRRFNREYEFYCKYYNELMNYPETSETETSINSNNSEELIL